MRPFVNAATLITSASLATGFVAMVLAAEGRLRAAAAAVVVAALLDAADGVVARRMSVAGRFGSHLDSLADLVAFGVAPALMLERGVLHAVPVLGMAVCLAFLLAGAWRLARFPLVEDRDRFVGLPIPPAGVIVAAVAALAVPAGAAVAVTVVLSLLMVSTVPFPTLAALRRLALPRLGVVREPRATGKGHVAARAPAARLSWRSRVARPAGRGARALGRHRRRARPWSARRRRGG